MAIYWEMSVMQFLDKGTKSIGLKAHSLPPLYVSWDIKRGRECAFSPTDFAPLSRNYIMVVSHYSHKDVHIELRHDAHNMAAIKQSSPKFVYFISRTSRANKKPSKKATAFTSKATTRVVTPFSSKATARANLPSKATAKAIPPYKAEFESILARKFKSNKRIESQPSCRAQWKSTL